MKNAPAIISKIIFCLTLAALTSCSSLKTPTDIDHTGDQQTLDNPTPQNSTEDRDHLLGWYQLGADKLIPVFKTNGIYYSVCHGFEIPFKPCPEGLEWAVEPSSMTGTTIGVYQNSNEVYINILDQLQQHFNELFIPPGKQTLTRTEKPAWVLDPTAQPPQNIDDFLGCYQNIWLPYRMQLRKDGLKYLCEHQVPDDSGAWITLEETTEITPLPGKLGFTGFDGNNLHLNYNDNLYRFELTPTKNPYDLRISMPLSHISTTSASDITPQPFIIIGIPSWR